MEGLRETEQACLACGGSVAVRSNRDMARCRSCGSMSRTQVGDLEEIYARAWDHPGSSTFAVGSTSTHLSSQFVGLAGSVDGRRVLDFGAGLGCLARGLAERNAVVTAIEPFGGDPLIEGVSWLTSFAELDIDESFDLIFMVEVIEHMPDPSATLSALRRRLSEGGILIVTTPNAAGLHARLRRRRWREATNPTHLCLFTHEGLEACLIRSGFGQVHRDNSLLDFGHSGVRKFAGAVLQRLRLDGSLRMIVSSSDQGG